MNESSHFALDCYYRSDKTTCCCVHFCNSMDRIPKRVEVEHFQEVAEAYKPGEFYRTELTFLTRLLQPNWRSDCVAYIDGYVWLHEQKPGLGAYLFDALGSIGAIVGIAKNKFVGCSALPVFRGKSLKPLFVTSVGLSDVDAATLVRNMSGNNRIPSMIKLADTGSRSCDVFDWKSWVENTSLF